MAAAGEKETTMAGVYTALITPFNADESVNWTEYAALVERQIEAGVDGLVICGTTAESPTLTVAEKHELIERAISIAAGRCQIVAGTGSNNTAATVEETAWAKKAGADACLIVNPYYNKPQQAGLVRHVRAVAEVGLPIMLYNIPGRSACLMEVPTILELAKLPEVRSIKDATGGVSVASAVAAACPLPILSGDDPLTLPMMAVGGVGVVSVITNVWPERMVEMVRAAAAGDYATARRHHASMLPLIGALFSETNPVPAKYALARMGLVASHGVRAPLAAIGEESKAQVDAALAAAGLIPE